MYYWTTYVTIISVAKQTIIQTQTCSPGYPINNLCYTKISVLDIQWYTWVKRITNYTIWYKWIMTKWKMANYVLLTSRNNTLKWYQMSICLCHIIVSNKQYMFACTNLATCADTDFIYTMMNNVSCIWYYRHMYAPPKSFHPIMD